MKMRAILSLSALVLTGISTSFSAHAAIPQSQSDRDYGTAIGALYSKTKIVVAGSNTYYVIATDLGEPAANSMQILVAVSNDSMEGEGPGAIFTVASGFAQVKSIEKKDDGVVISVLTNDVAHQSSNGSFPKIQTNYLLKYRQAQSDLSVQTIR